MQDPHRTLRVFVGFDPRQVISYTACATSILTHSTKPVAVTPLILETLPIERKGLTPFTYSRFLVPWLCNFEGWALFVDSDVIFVTDPSNLFGCAEDQYAVLIREQREPAFERAAIMLFNCAHRDNRRLTPALIDDEARCPAPHLINWTENVGVFDRSWGHLVGYDTPSKAAQAIHYTQGVPAWPETFECEWSDEWTRSVAISMWPWAVKQVESQLPWAALMGESVHARRLGDGRLVPKLYNDQAQGYAAPPAEKVTV